MGSLLLGTGARFLPLYDRNPLRVIPLQWVTARLIVICVVVFVAQLGFDETELSLFQFRYGMTRAILLEYPALDPVLAAIPSELTLISGMFFARRLDASYRQYGLPVSVW